MRSSVAVGVAVSFLMLVQHGCGGKQKVPEPKPPAPFLPGAGICPGALPGENLQVTVAMGESNFPEISWNGKHFDITWWDLRNPSPAVYTVGMSREGYEVSPLLQVSTGGRSKQHSLASDGRETHVVWKENDQIFRTRLHSGNPEVSLLSARGADPAAGPWGSAVYVEDGRLYFRCDGMIDLETGAPLPPVPIAAGGIESPRLAYNGVYFAVVWSESAPGGRHIVLQRVSPRGETLGGQVRVSGVAGQSRKPAIAWAGKNFAVAWTNAAPTDDNPRNRYRVFFAMVPEVGDRPLSTRQLAFAGSADQVSLAATGSEYAIAWVGSKENGGSAVYLQRLDLDGRPSEETIEITDGVPFVCSSPSLAWDGRGYAVAWHDDRGHVDTEVYMSYVACGDEAPGRAPREDAPADASQVPRRDDSGLPGLKEAF